MDCIKILLKELELPRANSSPMLNLSNAKSNQRHSSFVISPKRSSLASPSHSSPGRPQSTAFHRSSNTSPSVSPRQNGIPSTPKSFHVGNASMDHSNGSIHHPPNTPTPVQPSPFKVSISVSSLNVTTPAVVLTPEQPVSPKLSSPKGPPPAPIAPPVSPKQYNPPVEAAAQLKESTLSRTPKEKTHKKRKKKRR